MLSGDVAACHAATSEGSLVMVVDRNM